jgi:hypothetical protein
MSGTNTPTTAATSVERAVYVCADQDAHMDADVDRLRAAALPINVRVIPVGGTNTAMRLVVRRLCYARHLVLPDDFHRHTEAIERVKHCARNMGVEVVPLTRFILQHRVAPSNASECATPEPIGAAHGVSAAAG